MIANKKEFSAGAAMMVGFVAVLVVIFMPIFNGQNGLDYLDSLYNSISKGSAYYIPAVKEAVADHGEKAVSVTLTYPDDTTAQQAALLFNQNKAMVNISDSRLKVSGGLSMILNGALIDADDLYANQDAAITARYGYDSKRAVYHWWLSLKEMEKDLTRQKAFKDAKLVAVVAQKAVEPAYNYYGIDSQHISDKIGIVLFSLIFYVIYTLWYGFAIMYMFEGWGLQLEAH